MDIFILIAAVSNPGVPRSTRKPRMSSGLSPSSLAQTTARSAMGALVIQVLAPFNRNPSLTVRAEARREVGSEPESGSVSPKQPIVCAAAMRGSQRFFCSSLPKR